MYISADSEFHATTLLGSMRELATQHPLEVNNCLFVYQIGYGYVPCLITKIAISSEV